MNRSRILTLLMLVLCQSAWSQTRLDTIKMKLREHPEQDSMYGQILLKMAYEYFNVDVDSMRMLAEEIIRLGKKNQVQTQLIDGWRLMSSFHAAKMDHDASLTAAKRAHAVADSVGNRYYLALCSFSIAQNYQNLGQHEEAIPYLLEAKDAFSHLGKKRQLAAAMRLLGSCYNATDNWEKAREMYQEAIVVNRELNDQVWLAHLNVYIGSSYISEGGSYQETDTVTWHRLIRSGISYFDSAIVFYTQTNNLYGLGIATYNLATSYSHLGLLEESFAAFERGLDYGLRSGNKSVEYECRRGIAENLFKQKRFQEAIQAGFELLKEGEKTGKPEDFLEVYKVIANSAYEIKDFPTAYRYFNKYYEIELEPGATHSTKVRSASMLGEYEKKIQEIDLKELEAITSRNQQKLIGLWSLGGMLLLGGILWIWHQLRLRQKDKAIALEKQREQAVQTELSKARLELEQQRSQELAANLRLKQQLLTEQIQLVARRQEWLERISQAFPKTNHPASLRRTILQGMLETRNLDQIQALFHDLHPHFLPELKQQYPDLSRSELRLAALYKMELDNDEMVDFLCINPSSLKTFRTRLRKKLGLSPEQDLREFLQIM